MALKQTLHRLNQLWLRYEYKHTTFALFAVVVFVALFDSTIINAMLDVVEHLGYFGALVAGLLSVSFFTAIPAFVLIVDLAKVLDPIALAVVAGAGAMIGDWLLMLFFEERVIRELRPLLRRFGADQLAARLRRRSHAWVMLIGGVVAIATPIPDEIGVALLGISHFQQRYLLMICFALNTLGILGIVLAARALMA